MCLQTTDDNKKRQRGQISISMMCSELSRLNDEIRVFEEERVDYLHIDVMDGEFTPNLGLGTDYIRGLRRATDLPLELHLMINRPEDKLGWFDIQPEDRVIIHYESTFDLNRALERAERYRCKVMLALNPGTPVYAVEEVAGILDGVSILTVNPGFAGQKIVGNYLEKTQKMRKYLDTFANYKLLEVDGNITFEHADELRGAGADIFVAGSSSVMTGNFAELSDKIRSMKKLIE